ncbi:HPP family protein [Actinomycetospora cinnamomea]|uniref:CBS domain protein n=1 Tax=Actinomycetospora cinnamomea TaxID=663609 RepID=A0A2U1F3U5_9PSEU|nr:CBS domain-containing protein [Actinomycetospora cinnamomea]PVZ06819.1 CBS domain protein [Actinomycetospora cinnamomea]
MRTGDVMTTPVITVGPDTTVRDATALMAEHGVALLPVVSVDGRLVGVVAESDVLRGRVRHGPGDRDDALARTVGDVMTRAVCTVSPWTDVAAAVVLMVDRGLRSLPVVGEGGLVGIITRRDVARVLGRSDEDLRLAVSRRLDAYAGCHRWEVHAHRGGIVLCDEEDDPVQQHIATVLAAAVPGTVHVATHRRDSCPVHAVRGLSRPTVGVGTGDRRRQAVGP